MEVLLGKSSVNVPFLHVARIQFLACNVVTVRDVRITFEKSTVTVVTADVIGTRQASKIHIFQNGDRSRFGVPS